MAKESDTDLLMRFILEGDQTVWAECSMKIDDSDTLASPDFEGTDDLHEYTNYFQIDEFSFDLDLAADDASKGGAGGGGGTRNGGGSGGGGGSAGGGAGGGAGILLSDGFLQGNRHYQAGTTRGQRPGGTATGAPAAGADKKASGDFASWRSAKDDDIRDIAKSFKPEFKLVSFSKVIDAASPVLFESCTKAQKFDKAIIVKRVSQGGGAEDAGLKPLISYLRLDFEEVLIRSVAWSDGDLVKEKIQFEAHSVTMAYMPQTFDGSVDSGGKVEISYKRPQSDISS